MSTLGERIKEIRENYGLSQEEFGKKIGSARNTIANYENENRNPSNSVKVSICRTFNVNEEWLLTGLGERDAFELDDYTRIAAEIDKGDAEARQAIIDYWNLSPEDKKLVWNFVEKFIKK